MIVRSIPSVVVVVLVVLAGCPGASGEGEGEGEGAAGEGEGEGAAGEGEGEGEGEGASRCPAVPFAGCGGDVVGTWQLAEVCAPDGGSLTGPCETAFSGTAGCEGANDAATCTQIYGATVTLAADGSGTWHDQVSLARTEVLSAACASAAGGNADPALGCSALNGNATCVFDGTVCTCSATVDGGSDDLVVAYTVDGSGFHYHPTGGDPVDGAYFADGASLTMSNVFGWPFWVFDKQ